MYYDFKVKIPEVKGKIYERTTKECSLRSSAVAVPFLSGRFPTQNGRSFFNLSGETVFFCEGDKPKCELPAKLTLVNQSLENKGFQGMLVNARES